GVYFNFVIGIVSQNIDSPTNPVRFTLRNYQNQSNWIKIKNKEISIFQKHKLKMKLILFI
ncbi:hypothetical protein, partial [Acinetobacter baumannii]|uniref:hypothetical protein n=1 Tax=Acinetobacter baumannii TaxID=470 RepID=UPI0025A0665A